MNIARVLGMLVLCAAALAPAQQKKADVERGEETELSPAERAGLQTTQPGLAIALDGPVDPARYTIGPSDVLAVNIWTVPLVSYPLSVTPEGTLILPGIGEILVAGKTLSAARGEILALIKKKFLRADATVTLVRPRPVVVDVVGHVQNPGQYVLTAVDRAHKAIQLASAFTKLQVDMPGFYRVAWEQMSTRNIVLRHRDGTHEQVDLVRHAATRDDRYNPYLREGDVVIVPVREAEKQVFGIYGAVNAPGRFEFVRGDSVLDALQVAHGFLDRAVRDSVRLSRMRMDGQHLADTTIDLGAIADRSAPNIALQPGDRIVVPTREDPRGDFRVYVSGEVHFPGIYPITRNQTHLTDVIATAGGFTEVASLALAQVLRRSVGTAEVDLERLESVRGGVTADDSSYYYLETELRIQKEAVNVDFERLFLHGDSAQNVLLRDNDVIVVPMRRKTVYVFGQVVTAGHVDFVPGQPVNYYLAKAGGTTERARGGDVKVVKAKTRQWLSPDETTVEEGDYVWVPKDPERPFGYYLNIIGQTASVLSLAVSIVLLVTQVNK